MSEPDLEARWRALADKAVGGRFETLRHETDDRLVIEPLYARRRDNAPRPWRQSENWSVGQRVDHPDPVIANRFALLDLEGGADALTLVVAGSPYARGFGLDATRSALDAALAGVELDLVSCRLDAGSDTLAAANALAELAAERRLTSAGLDIDLGFDPIGLSARTGAPWKPASLRTIRDIAGRAGFAGRPLLADGRPYHEAGAGEAVELAAVLATGVAYLRHLEADGLDLAAARDGVAVLLPVDADLFLGLAKTRAMRRLWARIEAASGLRPRPLRLHAETSWRAMTRYDPWMNVMRASVGVAAAGLGGADAITVLPMTLPLGLPDDWTRRLARNTGRVLIDEANLAKVDDAAAGAGGFEALTDGLCAKAWALLQEIEAQGGIPATLDSGYLRGKIAETARTRAGAFAALTRAIVGTNHYPNLMAGEIAVLDVSRRPDTASPAPGALPAQRDAEPFEALRDRADARAASGHRPEITLVSLGTPASSGARVTYATNFFAMAGISALAVSATNVPAGSRILCLCGANADYATDGNATIASLRDHGATEILMVGEDKDWLGKGIDILIHDGMNALQVLSTLLEMSLRDTE